MKKLLISIGIIWALLLTGCQSLPDMYIQPLELTQREENILKLAGKNNETKIYEYKILNNIETITIRQLSLKEDGSWEEIGSTEIKPSGDNTGLLYISNTKQSEIATIGFLSDKNFTRWSHDDTVVGESGQQPPKVDVSKYSSIWDWQEEIAPIKQGEEIPLYLKGSNVSNSVMVCAIELFYDTEELDRRYEKVQAITIQFE